MTIREYIKRKAAAAVRAAAVPHIEAAVDQGIKDAIESAGDGIAERVRQTIDNRELVRAVEGAIEDWEPTSRGAERAISRALADYDFTDAIDEAFTAGDYLTDVLDEVAEEAVGEAGDAIRDRTRELLKDRMAEAVRDAVGSADLVDLDADLPFGIEIPDSPEPAATAGA